MNTTQLSATNLQAITDRARAAQRAWAGLSVRQRLVYARQFRGLLYRETDRFAEVIATEVGKSIIEALGGDVLSTADAVRFLERQAEQILRPRQIARSSRPTWLMGQSDVVHRRPRGVIGIIGTWNYPLFLNGVQVMQALVAGNAVLWKPSEITPRFAELLHQLLLEAGFPSDLVVGLPATREMGPALAEADVDHVVFTGSAQVGRKLAARLGERLISSTLELSGCDAQFVLADADVRLAARAAWFGTNLNRGQTCIAVRRAFVQRPLYAEFCTQIGELAAQFISTPLTIPAQEQQAEQLVRQAVEAGAKRLAANAGVVVDARPEMRICQEAAFAPVMAVLPFDTIEEALRMEAECPYALGASIFTRSLEQGQLIAAQLRAGTVTINDVIVPTSHPATPFGGRQSSGWGVTQGAEGLLEMTVPQVVSVRSGSFRPHYDMSDPEKLKIQGELLRGFLAATHAPRFRQRLGGWWRIVRAAWRGL